MGVVILLLTRNSSRLSTKTFSAAVTRALIPSGESSEVLMCGKFGRPLLPMPSQSTKKLRELLPVSDCSGQWRCQHLHLHRPLLELQLTSRFWK